MFLFVTSLPMIICVICMLVVLVKIDSFSFYVVIAKKEMLSSFSIRMIQTIRIVIMLILSQWIAIGVIFCSIIS